LCCFSWDDYGNYDIPAAINYILTLKGQSSLIYTGHSLGCGQFWIAMIKHPELIAKIDLMVKMVWNFSFTFFTCNVFF
jgi:lysosomal acid lipase/cholesteryl ester hydrolase